MRQLFLAALGVFAVAGFASAQQPQVQYIPQPAPSPAAAVPVIAASGTNYIRGSGCTNCGVPAVSQYSLAGCQMGSSCSNGCGSVKSDLAFHFGSCKSFFDPCGPTCGGRGHGRGSLFGDRCPTYPLAQPYGTGWFCPRQYDSNANH